MMAEVEKMTLGSLKQAEGEFMKNEMEMEFDAISNNESFARVAVAAFVSHLDPTLEEVSDIKTAVSEAVTNAIIHGYDNIHGYGRHGDVKPAYLKINPGKIRIHCLLELNILHIEIEDKGKGIENVDKAMEPLFTTRPELERSGMGFAFMEAFMDDLEVASEVGAGTIVRMKKKMGAGAWIPRED
jgi:stage II sporulation protein AB (anti-sigma F factor)